MFPPIVWKMPGSSDRMYHHSKYVGQPSHRKLCTTLPGDPVLLTSTVCRNSYYCSIFPYSFLILFFFSYWELKLRKNWQFCHYVLQVVLAPFLCPPLLWYSNRPWRWWPVLDYPSVQWLLSCILEMTHQKCSPEQTNTAQKEVESTVVDEWFRLN